MTKPSISRGKARPFSRLQVVSNLADGIVVEILVHAGDKVQAGQPLLHLDATAFIGEGGARLPISAGMIAEVDVLSRKRTVPNYLLTRQRETAFREKL